MTKSARIGLFVLGGILTLAVSALLYIYFAASGWPEGGPPPIAQGVVAEMDWVNWEADSAKFTSELRRKYPNGTFVSTLGAELAAQGFKPACGTGGAAPKMSDCTTLLYSWGGLPCRQNLKVWWTADKKARIAYLEGGYGVACL